MAILTLSDWELAIKQLKEANAELERQNHNQKLELARAINKIDLLQGELDKVANELQKIKNKEALKGYAYF